MKRHLSSLVLAFVLMLSVLVPLLPSTASAATSQDNTDAKNFCKTAKFSDNSALSADYQLECVAGYTQVRSLQEANVSASDIAGKENAFCNTAARQGTASTACSIGWNGAVANSTTVTTPDAAKICNPYSGDKLSDCTTALNAQCAGWANGTNPDNQLSACVYGAIQKLDGATNNCSSKYKANAGLAACNGGFQNTTAPGGGGGAGSTTPDAAACENSDYPLSWIMCKVIDGLSDGVDWIYGSLVQPLLQTQPIDLTNNNDPSHTFEIWSNFRIYGDIFLVIALLVIVFGESIGGGLIDAYSAKKILPRLLVAAILINLSIYLIALAVDITNIVGNGMNDLLQSPFTSQINSGNYYVLHMSKGTGAVGSALTVAAIVGAAFKAKVALDGLMYLLVIFLIPAFFVFLAIMATVILRRGLILLLIFFAPVAFALYCLPNTEKYFRQWWDTLFKALLVYPIIAVMFALGNIMSVVISSSTTGLAGAMATLIGVVAMCVPLFLIPYSFRIAGGLLGRFHDFATQAATKGHQAVHGDERDPDSMKNRAKRRFAVSRNEANLTGKAFSNRLGNTLTRPQDLVTTSGRERRRGQLAAVREAGRQKLGGQFAESDPIYQANQKNDQYLLALANEGMAQDKRRAAEAKGNKTEVAAWDQAINSARATPKNAATRMRALNDLASTGFQFEAGQKGYDQLAKTVADITGVSPSELQTDPATGHVIGATGTNAGVYANAMNNAQYGLRTAGRYDLGGINNGQGFDAKGGLNKASLYELANGKGDSITTMVETLPAGPAGHEHAVVYKELESMLPNAKGAVRDEIVTQMRVLESPAVDVKDYMNQVVTLPGPAPTTPVPTRVLFDNTNTAHTTGPTAWDPEDRARGWRTENLVPPPPTETRGQQAQREARAYERPNPERM